MATFSDIEELQRLKELAIYQQRANAIVAQTGSYTITGTTGGTGGTQYVPGSWTVGIQKPKPLPPPSYYDEELFLHMKEVLDML